MVDLRSRIGDWELDTIIGKGHRQAIVSLTERKSRYTLIQKVKRKTAQCVTNAIINLLSPVSDQVLTLTSDNGKEFANHKSIAKKLNAKFFFADTYSSQQRGTNENTNGLIRQYLPKKTCFQNLAPKRIKFIQNRLNNRPRKGLQFNTPLKVCMSRFSLS